MDILSAAIHAAKLAGEIARRDFSEPRQSRFKKHGEVITSTDIRMEKCLFEVIHREFPDHSIWSEEGGSLHEGVGSCRWVFDPLDGSRNFAQRIPFFNTALAYFENDIAVAAVVYNPMNDSLFAGTIRKIGVSRRGAYCNGKRIHVSRRRDITHAVVDLSRGTAKKEKKRYARIMEKIGTAVGSTRSFGSTLLDLCMVAKGSLDACICNGFFPHDSYAGMLIARLAGAVTSTFQGDTKVLQRIARSDIRRDFFVCAPGLFRQFLPLLKGV